MTNPNTRKTGTSTKSAASLNSTNQINNEAEALLGDATDSTSDARDINDFTLLPTSNTEDVEGEDETNSCSSFSLQECINEFRARRIRRLSTQSRDGGQMEECVVDGAVAAEKCDKATLMDPADADLINQNRSNKAQERKCKPCRNGFCYCFTSDSGDGGVCGAAATTTRAAHVRQPRRTTRRSECNESSALIPQMNGIKSKENCRQSAPATFKMPVDQEQQALPQQKEAKKTPPANCAINGNQLTAISCLETTSYDAPLIHIVQELRDNCVISEVRVNKHKIKGYQHSQDANAQSAKSSPQKQTQQTRGFRDIHAPTAPLMEGLGSNLNKPPQENLRTISALEKISELDSLSDAFAYSTPLSSSKNNDSGRRKHKAGGKLLQKRLSHSSAHLKQRRSTQAPPKPPRSYLCLDEKSTVSSFASTTPSVREAERIIDDFLLKRGVKIGNGKQTIETGRSGKADKWSQVDVEKLKREMAPKRREMRKSYPASKCLTMPNTKAHKILPSCPSLTDIQRIPTEKLNKSTNYEKNICQFTAKPVKELSFGWKEAKITEMLNCDTSANQRQFKSQAVQAEPQQTIGWQVPHKVDIDTVDGGVRSNLASNIEIKNTPVKTPPISARKERSTAHESQKFIWGEQWRNLSPWAHNKSANSGCAFKSNLKSSSRALFQCSKKKILRLVTPKRNNLPRHRETTKKPVSLCNVGVQTSPEELCPYEPSSTPQSPPGSYHSAVQTSTQSTTPTCSQNTNTVDIGVGNDFDFSRTVHPPTKNAPRAATQRKLTFPLDCTARSCVTCKHGTFKDSMKTKTYHSYHNDIDQDVRVSKLGYILGNIRAKLEASDEHAVRTFQEIERREHQAAGEDFTDGSSSMQVVPMHTNVQHHHDRRRRSLHQDPIYSEIEEDSFHIKGTPQYDNSTGLQRNTSNNQNIQELEVIYAKVNKQPKPQKATQLSPTALGKILHDSLRTANVSAVTPLPTLREQSSNASDDTSYMSPPPLNLRSETSSLSHCQSLNNVRVQEQHSPPKKDRSLLSKSDLSLHRSEIFLDNLCRGEIIVGDGELDRIEKVNNTELEQSRTSLQSEQRSTYRHFSTSTPTPSDSISYDIPDDPEFECATSQLGLSIEDYDQQSTAQSTSNKESVPRFTTKSHGIQMKVFNLNLGTEESTETDTSPHKRSSSCPTTPHKSSKEMLEGIPHNVSLIEIHSEDQLKESDTCEAAYTSKKRRQNPLATSSTSSPSTGKKIAHYQRLKNVLRKSLRRSKNFVKNETKRLSSSFNFPTPHSCGSTKGSNHNKTDPQIHTSSSSYDLDVLFALDEQTPVTQQLAQTVSLCRQLPELEISPEMVEAERLLLFSKLRRDTRPLRVYTPARREAEQQMQRFYIDGMQLPVRMDPTQDFFFNYFYIVTFECGGVIKSTQSAECQNGQAIFSDCGIEFACGLAQDGIEVNCNIFMLRLRKVSTLSLEPRRPVVKRPNALTDSTKSSSSSGDEIISRFRLHASFSLNARDLIPYEYVESESKNTNKLCLRASGGCELPLTAHTRSTNLAEAIQLTGRAEIRVPKHAYSGYLNVQDPHTQHNWNRRWCALNGLRMYVLEDENQLLEQPILSLDLHYNSQQTPLAVAPRELCARPRAFCLQCVLHKAGEEVATAAVFFAADTQPELEAWLQHLNNALKFVEKWMI